MPAFKPKKPAAKSTKPRKEHRMPVNRSGLVEMADTATEKLHNAYKELTPKMEAFYDKPKNPAKILDYLDSLGRLKSVMNSSIEAQTLLLTFYSNQRKGYLNAKRPGDIEDKGIRDKLQVQAERRFRRLRIGKNFVSLERRKVVRRIASLEDAYIKARVGQTKEKPR